MRGFSIPVAKGAICPASICLGPRSLTGEGESFKLESSVGDVYQLFPPG